MASDVSGGDMVPENLRKQLGLGVRSINWSYAIYWSSSATHTGILTWADGYYNGDVKTRKTNQIVNIDPDLLDLSRSEQLRELYESLSTEETNPQAKRSLTALCPEDLSNTEWYYLVCMSFIFKIGEGLPGRARQSGQPIWLCDACNVDSQTFSRSLLAKSAPIKTVVCFPFMEGVVELGTSELVPEDSKLIQHFKTVLEPEYHVSHENLTTSCIPKKQIMQANLIASPIENTYGFELDRETENCFQVKGTTEEAAHAQSKLSNSMSMNINLGSKEVVSVPEKHDYCWQEDECCNHTKSTLMDHQCNDMHYQNVLSSLFKTSHQLIQGPQFRNLNSTSSFVLWRKPDLAKCQKLRMRAPQNILKKILFEVPRMYGDHLNKFSDGNSNRDVVSKPEVDDTLTSHKWRVELDERLNILGSMLPFDHKKDKISILDDTIAYLKKFQERVEVCKSCNEFTKSEAKLKKKFHLQERAERTPNNYGKYKTSNRLKSLLKKRKNSEIETESGIDHLAPRNSSVNYVNVRIIDQDVLITMRCAWKEGVFLEIIDVLSHHHLDSHSVHSSINNQVLHLTIKSKFKGSNMESSGMIKLALQRIVRNCL